MTFGILTMAQVSGILQAMKDIYFDVEYPDPMVGDYVIKNFLCRQQTELQWL